MRLRWIFLGIRAHINNLFIYIFNRFLGNNFNAEQLLSVFKHIYTKTQLKNSINTHTHLHARDKLTHKYLSKIFFTQLNGDILQVSLLH